MCIRLLDRMLYIYIYMYMYVCVCVCVCVYSTFAYSVFQIYCFFINSQPECPPQCGKQGFKISKYLLNHFLPLFLDIIFVCFIYLDVHILGTEIFTIVITCCCSVTVMSDSLQPH